MSFSGILVVDGIAGFFAVDHLARAADALDELEAEIEGYARDNAPWTDRTGAARAGLTAQGSHSGVELELTLAHTVDYGLWLEVIQSGRFAIIMPTLEHYGPIAARKAGGAFTLREG